MKRKSAMFWNNSCEWLKRWYGISAVKELYSGYDFVEANGRVFFKARLSTILDDGVESISNLMTSKDAEMLEDKYASATGEDFFVGFIKPTSQKITILDVLPESAAVLAEHPTISTNSSSISWIKDVNVCDDRVTITINNASSQYSDDYNITTSEFVLKDINVNSIKPLMALLSYEPKDQFTYVFIQNPSDAENAYSLISVSNEGDTDTVCRYDRLFGYNENTIYLSNGSDIILVDRQNGKATKMDKLADDLNYLAYVDTARNEFFYYEDNKAKYPGQSALIGMSLSARDGATKVEKERISCPDVVSTPANPLIFDGYKYIWRLNTLWKGYKLFRKDGSLREQFILKQDKETSDSPIVFSSPTVIFVEWEGGLAYSTNKGLCLMSELDDTKQKKLFYPEPEDR